MKKQLALVALAGGILMMAAPKANADVTPVQITSGSTGPSTIKVEGFIPEYILFSGIDPNLELGDIGGPERLGSAVSTSGSKTNDNQQGTSTFTGTTSVSSPTVGYGQVEVKANTFIKIAFSGSNVKNAGPDAAITGDDIELPTKFRLAAKGTVRFNQFAGASQGDTGVLIGDPQNPNYSSLPGFTATNTDGYASYSTAFDANTVTALTYAPGGRRAPNNANGVNGNPVSGPNDPSGLRIMAEVERHGLNDYKGTYTSNINLTYYKF